MGAAHSFQSSPTAACASYSHCPWKPCAELAFSLLLSWPPAPNTSFVLPNLSNSYTRHLKTSLKHISLTKTLSRKLPAPDALSLQDAMIVISGTVPGLLCIVASFSPHPSLYPSWTTKFLGSASHTGFPSISPVSPIQWMLTKGLMASFFSNCHTKNVVLPWLMVYELHLSLSHLISLPCCPIIALSSSRSKWPDWQFTLSLGLSNSLMSV